MVEKGARGGVGGECRGNFACNFSFLPLCRHLAALPWVFIMGNRQEEDVGLNLTLWL